MTMSEFLSKAEAWFSGNADAEKKLASKDAEIKTLTAERDALTTELTQAKSDLEAANIKAAAEAESAATTLAELKNTHEAALTEARAQVAKDSAKQAQELMAKLGLKPEEAAKIKAQETKTPLFGFDRTLAAMKASLK
jgi:chromosome segregation ATPase